jgi:hypothetical protein
MLKAPVGEKDQAALGKCCCQDIEVKEFEFLD